MERSKREGDGRQAKIDLGGILLHSSWHPSDKIEPNTKV